MKYEKYAEIRDRHGFNDSRVAKETGIATATLSEWKAKKYEPKIDKLIKIADLFGEPIEKFIRE